jgi:hypothetical protein
VIVIDKLSFEPKTTALLLMDFQLDRNGVA